MGCSLVVKGRGKKLGKRGAFLHSRVPILMG
jgi:hypothetical protein